MADKTPMIKMYNEDGDLFISEECLKEFEEASRFQFKNWEEDELKRNAVEEMIDNDISMILSDPLHKELVALNAKRFKLNPRIAILEAHGKYINGKWVYYNGTRFMPVQRWINENDGKYSCLMLDCCNCCNLQHQKIHSRKSAMLVPTHSFSPLRHNSGLANLELYVPGIEYVSSYTIQHEIEIMKKLLKRR